MSKHFKTIYAQAADQYHQLVSFEDYQGNLLPELLALLPTPTNTIIELGAGTGRLTALLADQIPAIHAVDQSAAMLSEGRRHLADAGFDHINLIQADNHAVPIADKIADAVLEGWSFGHMLSWYPSDWPRYLQQALTDAERVLKPEGVIILIETLGTGAESPNPPNDDLALLYQVFEAQYGFQRRWVRTDYRFDTVDRAVTLTRFFFGDELAQSVAERGSLILPECTGIWHKVV